MTNDCERTDRGKVTRYDVYYEKSEGAESWWDCRLPHNNNVTRHPLGKKKIKQYKENADTGSATRTWTA